MFLFLAAATGEDPGTRAQAAAFAQLLGDKDLGPIAEQALVRMGDDAIPALAAVMADVNSPARGEAAALLGRLGRESDAAKKALRVATDDRDAGVRVAACVALLDLGDSSDAVVAGLASALSSTDEQARRAAAAGLRKAGKDGKSAIPALISALNDRDAGVRDQASATLAGLGVAAVGALDSSAKADSRVQRASAVRALAGIGADARSAVPTLIELLKDDSDQVRLEAAAALGNIGKPAANAGDALRLIVMTADARGDLRQACVIALDKIGPAGWDTDRALQTLWKSKDALVRAFAARQVGQRKVAGAIPMLMVGVNDMSHLVRTEAAMAMVAVDPSSKEVLMVMQAALADRLLLSPRVAATALGMMGSNAAPAKAALQEAQLSEDEELAAAAKAALEKIG